MFSELALKFCFNAKRYSVSIHRTALSSSRASVTAPLPPPPLCDSNPNLCVFASIHRTALSSLRASVTAPLPPPPLCSPHRSSDGRPRRSSDGRSLTASSIARRGWMTRWIGWSMLNNPNNHFGIVTHFQYQPDLVLNSIQLRALQYRDPNDP
jgi:hypothetical protein